MYYIQLRLSLIATVDQTFKKHYWVLFRPEILYHYRNIKIKLLYRECDGGFLCKDRSRCVSSELICDGRIDCRDGYVIIFISRQYF